VADIARQKEEINPICDEFGLGVNAINSQKIDVAAI